LSSGSCLGSKLLVKRQAVAEVLNLTTEPAFVLAVHQQAGFSGLGVRKWVLVALRRRGSFVQNLFAAMRGVDSCAGETPDACR
jgi:hypothetical protein